ncbi:hypothetical protein BKA69DRAFT_1135879 [Paraphysoderma sedebokerense]|nr:hypothetical protein BKA69DRAFT_1135879 [Paraphysoderma sedebokerense]
MSNAQGITMGSCKIHIHDLPNEILLVLPKYVQPEIRTKFLLSSISVSSRFFTLYAPLLYKCVEFDNSRSYTTEIIDFMNTLDKSLNSSRPYHSYVEQLYMWSEFEYASFRDDIVPLLRTVMPTLNNLSALTIRCWFPHRRDIINNEVSSLLTPIYCAAAFTLPKLQKIDMHLVDLDHFNTYMQTSCRDDTTSHISNMNLFGFYGPKTSTGGLGSMLARFPQLREMSLFHCFQFNRNLTNDIWKDILSAENVRELRLHYPSFEHFETSPFAFGKNVHNRSITTLYLQCIEGCSDSVLDFILSSLSNLSHLTLFGVRPRSAAELIHYPSLLRQTSKLKYFRYSRCLISNISVIFEAFNSKDSELSELWLQSPDIDDSVINVLCGHPSLVTVNIDGCSISHAALINFLRSTTSISVYSTSSTSLDSKFLESVIETCANIKMITISCEVLKSGFQSLWDFFKDYLPRKIAQNSRIPTITLSFDPRSLVYDVDHPWEFEHINRALQFISDLRRKGIFENTVKIDFSQREERY